MPSFFRQLSGKDGWGSSSSSSSSSRRFGTKSKCNNIGGEYESNLKKMQGMSNYNNNMYGGGDENEYAMRKRVMVVVDQSSSSKHAMMWALTHLTNKGDLLTLLHIISPDTDLERSGASSSPYLAKSLGALCKASKPEVEVEALVIQGPKLATVMSQVKKLEVSVLVLGQKKPSSLLNCFCGTLGKKSFVDECIKNSECLTLGVRKQSRGMGGYLISSRWQKDFWLLA